MKTPVCKICTHAGDHRPFDAREMMFGSRETFAYFECVECGCVQIVAPPADLARHYPANYACHRPVDLPLPRSPLRRLRRWLRWRRVDFELGSRHPLAWLGRAVVPWRQLGPGLEWINQPDLGISRRSRVLDVGAGTGAHLLLLASLGFQYLLGVDPFIPAELRLADGAVRILKTELSQVEGLFDLITFHHSLEHVLDPGAMLAQAGARLAPGGVLIIRIPVAGTHAWKTYGPDWVQLDAPRHQFLFTPRSLARLAEQHGFAVVRTVWDSYALQFWGSEQYRRDIPLDDPRSVLHEPPNGPFKLEEMERFRAESVRLNASAEGDQAVFFLQRPITG